MSNGIPTRHPDPLCGGSDDDLAAYIRAEQMLDRYGVAYVCQHPEILVGIVPPIDSGYGAHASGQVYSCNARDVHLRTLVRGHANDTEDLLDRAIEAYRTLDEIFAPQSSTRYEPQSPRAHAHGRIPAQPDGRSALYGRWYC